MDDFLSMERRLSICFQPFSKTILDISHRLKSILWPNSLAALRMGLGGYGIVS